MEVPQKIKGKLELPYDPAIPLQIFIQKNWIQDLKEIFTHSCSLQHFYNSQEMQATQITIDR